MTTSERTGDRGEREREREGREREGRDEVEGRNWGEREGREDMNGMGGRRWKVGSGERERGERTGVGWE